MHFLQMTFLYCALIFFSGDPALVSTPSSSAKIGKSLTADSTKTNPVGPETTNVILQSKDGGLTWEDISYGLPENEQPVEFFAGASDLYLHVNDETYRSKSNLETPVWEKENALVARFTAIAFNPPGVVEAEGVIIRTGQKGIMRSTDNGEHWEWVISEGGVGIAVERIDGGFAAISYNAGTQSRRIRISLDNGKTWKAIDDGLQPSLSISSIKQIGQHLICGHPDGIFRSSDMGKTWNIVHPSVDRTPLSGKTWSIVPARDNRRVFKIYVSGNVVYAVAGNSGC